MKLVIDACVLFPTVMRQVVLGVAERGLFTPLWSARILEEWARAARKIGPEGEVIARGEIATVSLRFPKAEVRVPEGAERRFWLPDPEDIHVLAAAVGASADGIMTLNAKDFPRNILSEEGLERVAPDTFLMRLWMDNPQPVAAAAQDVLDEARRLSGEDWDMRSLLRKARLPRLGKALSA